MSARQSRRSLNLMPFAAIGLGVALISIGYKVYTSTKSQPNRNIGTPTNKRILFQDGEKVIVEYNEEDEEDYREFAKGRNLIYLVPSNKKDLIIEKTYDNVIYFDKSTSITRIINLLK